jgi:IS1 family transposase
VKEIWEIKVERRIRQNPQNRKKIKKIKRKSKGTFRFPEIVRY